MEEERLKTFKKLVSIYEKNKDEVIKRLSQEIEKEYHKGNNFPGSIKRGRKNGK